MNIGEKIKDYRKKAGLTQKQLAEKIDRKEITIRKYESGEREPRISVIEDICKALNIPIDEFGEELFQINNDNKENKDFRDSLELFKKYESNSTFKYISQSELVSQLMLLHGYTYEYYSWSGRTEEEAYKIDEKIQSNTLPLGKITNLNTNEKFNVSVSDLEQLYSNLKNFIDFELFKLKNKYDK